MTGVLLIISFKFALYGKLNQGVISSLFSITSIYIAICSWILYKEALHFWHFIGMFFLISWALLISFSGDNTEGEVVEIDGKLIKEISPFWGVLLAIITTFLFFIRTMAIKEYYNRFDIDPMDLTVASYIFQGVIVAVVLITMETAPWDIMRDSFIAGGFGFLGNTLINHATTKGYAGPAAALTNIQVVLQVSIDALFLNQIPNGMQVAACIWGIIGSLSITLIPFLWEKWLQRK